MRAVRVILGLSRAQNAIDHCVNGRRRPGTADWRRPTQIYGDSGRFHDAKGRERAEQWLLAPLVPGAPANGTPGSHLSSRGRSRRRDCWRGSLSFRGRCRTLNVGLVGSTGRYRPREAGTWRRHSPAAIIGFLFTEYIGVDWPARSGRSARIPGVEPGAALTRRLPQPLT